MATRYMDRCGSWTSGYGNVVFTGSSYKRLTTWAINQLLAWHRNDPVSTLESARNEAVYGIQSNRNPFVDYPELAEYIWGNMQGNTWTPGGTPTPTPTLTSPTNGSTVNVGTNTGNGVSKSITVKGSNLTKALTVSVSGTGFSVTPTSITAANANNGTTVTVTYNGTASNATGVLTISSSEVSASVNLTASYNSGGDTPVPGDEIIETWEGCTGYENYTNKSVQGKAFSWYFSNAGIFAQSNDHWNDAIGCRFGKNADSYIEMTEDVADGACKITFYAANYGSDTAPTIQVQYSTNGGSTWTTVATCSPNSTWKQYSYDLNVTGNVRFKIAQTAGSRLNIDDIAITLMGDEPILNPEISISQVVAMEADFEGESTIATASVIADNNNENITLSVSGNFEISLNRQSWARTLTLDPTGETFYVRLANTDTAGEYDGILTASTSLVSAYAELQGTVNPKTVKLGDANMDGSVTIADVSTLIDYLLSGDVTPFDELAADVNQDQSITIADVSALIDILLEGPVKALSSRWDAVPVKDGILCENYSDEILEIFDYEGNRCGVVSRGECVIDLPNGIYLVTGEEISRKVVVK